MVGFASATDVGRFDFDEVADMHVVGKLRCRTQAREGSDYAVSADLRFIDDQMGWGVGLAIGIATLCALIENNPSNAHN